MQGKTNVRMHQRVQQVQDAYPGRLQGRNPANIIMPRKNMRVGVIKDLGYTIVTSVMFMDRLQ